jgi:hypothetical protein
VILEISTLVGACKSMRQGPHRFLLVRDSMGGLVALLNAERNANKLAGFVNVLVQPEIE